MSSFKYRSSRFHERDLLDDEDDHYYAGPLVRRDTKRLRITRYDDEDDKYDDYPLAKPSRAITIRKPSQIEKYNIWSHASSPKKTRYFKEEEEEDDRDDRDDRKHELRFRYTSSGSRSDDEDRGYKLKVRATFSRPKSASPSRETPFWSVTRKEKRESLDWERRERERRERRDSFDDDWYREKTIKYHHVKTTTEDDWKPLTGFRKFW